MAVKAELELREILLTTGQVQPIKVESKGGRISAICRQLPGQEKAWLASVDTLLRMGEEQGVGFHICRKYLLKDTKLVYGWHVGIEAKGAADLGRCLVLLRAAAESFVPNTEPDVAPDVASSQENQEPIVSPVPAAARAARAAEMAKHTDAHPREADAIRPDPVPPAGYNVERRVVFTGKARDQKNRIVPVVIEEFPLPHVFVQDMNKPNDKDRGAKTL